MSLTLPPSILAKVYQTLNLRDASSRRLPAEGADHPLSPFSTFRPVV